MKKQNMNSKVETVESSMDSVKLVIALLIAVAAMAAFYIYPEQSALLRVGGLLLAAGVAVGIALQTAKGRNIWGFFHGAQIEVRKVVWPTRQETVQTTLIVVLVVVLVSIILWLLDMFLGWTIGTLMGQRGYRSMSLNWYVVHAYSGFEDRVMNTLKERVVQFGMEDNFGEILVPKEEVVEMREGKKRTTDRKFFPGYVLVQMEMNDDTWHMVKEMPRVLGFIGGTSDRPAPISEDEANSILQRVEEGVDKPTPKVMFEAGEVIRVIDGPFKDFNGVVEEVNYEKNRLRVSVLIFGRSTPVDLEFTQVEKD